MPKAAAIFVIALVLVAAVLLYPDGARPPLAARAPAVHMVAQPGILLPTLATAHAKPDRSRRQRASLPAASSRMASARQFTRMPAATDTLHAIGARPMLVAADAAPAVTDAPPATRRPGHVSRALATAANETSGAFRTAGRAIRSVF